MTYLILGIQNMMMTSEKSHVQFELATLMNDQSEVQSDMKALKKQLGEGYEDDNYYMELERMDEEFELSKAFLETQIETLEKNCESLEKKESSNIKNDCKWNL